MNELTTLPKSEQPVMRESQPLTSSQVLSGLNAIRSVMKDCMVEKQDYGKVPGCGDKPGLFQPGAQKLSMMFQLNPEVREEVISDYPNYHRGYRLIVRVTNGAKFADGVGECSTLEGRYRFRTGSLKCPQCGKPTIFKDKEGKGWYCWAKKGGCGAQFVNGSEQANTIASQDTGKVENDNPADCWNTVRKMAFKRAFVHAIINATNTSELWSQDLEDLAANGNTPETASEPSGGFETASPVSSHSQEVKTPPSGNSDRLQADWPDSEVEVVAILDSFDQKNVTSKKNGKTYLLTTLHMTTKMGEKKFDVTTFQGEKDELEVLQGQDCVVTHKPDRNKKGRELVNIQPHDEIPM